MAGVVVYVCVVSVCVCALRACVCVMTNDSCVVGYTHTHKHAHTREESSASLLRPVVQVFISCVWLQLIAGFECLELHEFAMLLDLGDRDQEEDN